MRLIPAVMAILFLFSVTAFANEGPDSIYTGEANTYVSASQVQSHSRSHRKIRHSVRDRSGDHWSRKISVREFAGGIVRSKSGASAHVNPANASKFQCLINRLEATGYRIRFMGGYRKTKIAGTNVWSKHASGNAIDINQTARNVTHSRMPASATGIARECGLLHGAVWRNPDAGHFEVP